MSDKVEVVWESALDERVCGAMWVEGCEGVVVCCVLMWVSQGSGSRYHIFGGLVKTTVALR